MTATFSFRSSLCICTSERYPFVLILPQQSTAFPCYRVPPAWCWGEGDGIPSHAGLASVSGRPCVPASRGWGLQPDPTFLQQYRCLTLRPKVFWLLFQAQWVFSLHSGVESFRSFFPGALPLFTTMAAISPPLLLGEPEKKNLRICVNSFFLFFASSGSILLHQLTFVVQ